MSKETGGQEFTFMPCFESKNTEEPGVMLRDYFAGQVLIGALSNQGGVGNPINLAGYAYSVADAMIRARNQ